MNREKLGGKLLDYRTAFGYSEWEIRKDILRAFDSLTKENERLKGVEGACQYWHKQYAQEISHNNTLVTENKEQRQDIQGLREEIHRSIEEINELAGWMEKISQPMKEADTDYTKRHTIPFLREYHHIQSAATLECILDYLDSKPDEIGSGHRCLDGKIHTTQKDDCPICNPPKCEHKNLGMRIENGARQWCHDCCGWIPQSEIKQPTPYPARNGALIGPDNISLTQENEELKRDTAFGKVCKERDEARAENERLSTDNKIQHDQAFDFMTRYQKAQSWLEKISQPRLRRGLGDIRILKESGYDYSAQVLEAVDDYLSQKPDGGTSKRKILEFELPEELEGKEIISATLQLPKNIGRYELPKPCPECGETHKPKDVPEDGTYYLHDGRLEDCPTCNPKDDFHGNNLLGVKLAEALHNPKPTSCPECGDTRQKRVVIEPIERVWNRKVVINSPTDITLAGNCHVVYERCPRCKGEKII